ncbi:(2Fe-2S)-binding protein [Streptomyces thermoalcalitolerans]|uniref:(2Fe-2S)-binding protein n=1 Tax=Streptomyces thermoalcalitolerans TaxID=65605 RepID=A0ABP3YX97_9ACTN
MDLAPDLAALRPLGGFFVLRTGTPPHGRLPTLAQVYAQPAAGPHDTHPLDVRVRTVAHGIRAPEPRVAASIAHQALAARLWSAALGCAALYGGVPDLDPHLLHWDPAAQAPDDLWLTEVRARPADASTIAAVVLHGHLEPLAAALRARHRLAPGLLRGNAASALASTGRLLAAWARDHGRAEAADRARELTTCLLTHPLLGRAGTLTGTAFRRRSCCLYYRVPGGGLCGDCCFTRPPGSSPKAASGRPGRRPEARTKDGGGAAQEGNGGAAAG